MMISALDVLSLKFCCFFWWSYLAYSSAYESQSPLGDLNQGFELGSH